MKNVLLIAHLRAFSKLYSILSQPSLMPDKTQSYCVDLHILSIHMLGVFRKH